MLHLDKLKARKISFNNEIVLFFSLVSSLSFQIARCEWKNGWSKTRTHRRFLIKLDKKVFNLLQEKKNDDNKNKETATDANPSEKLKM